MAASSDTPQKPAIVIVPGSFSPEALYTSILDQLRTEGYEAIYVRLPSIGRRPGVAAATMAEDALYIQSVTTKLAEEGKDIVMVMHSYGGVPGTESAKGLAKAHREAAGKPGGIVNLVYFTAIVLEVGMSFITFHDANGSALPAQLQFPDDYMHLEPYGNAAATFSDIPESDGLAWTAKMEDHSAISFHGELTYAAYKYIPSTFLLCEEDKVLPPAYQEKFITTIQDNGGNVARHTCALGHCPNISKPDIVVQVIRSSAGR